ncbi:hypothetical protein [Flavihumibacter fluvii]|uniref:hypothetical protein n=1 Tax=Flavihumibacter fluvii TaxID=2838157 RepID=UPI001BDE424E|nr:hypothetical protein [Flavihumibacter fluvii]ULQ51552.1 hypothetical protein KJS93_15795 [Flavihumibacter fluvii]
MKCGELLRTSFLAILFFTCSHLKAQVFDSLLTKLDKQYPQEKLYFQFDKSSYNPGETIWFKAYLTSANLLSTISKNLYAELYDQQGKLLQRKISPFAMAGAAGGFELPTDLADSVLYLRAYTNWMLNFDTTFLYYKTIPIFTEKTATAKKTVAAPVTTLQFFPEGGDLVQGIESFVAFKATDARGLPVKVSGDIVDAKGAKIIPFTTAHDGMGKFLFKPEPGNQYKAVWKDAAGKQQQSNLPAAKNKGIVLSAYVVADAIQFTIKRQEDGAADYPSVNIVAQMQQQLIYEAKANLSNSIGVRASIPLENIPTGIVQITLFSPDNKPLAERIVFVNRQDYYFITDLNTPVKSFQKRAKNVIQVDVPDTLICNLSIAVTDLGVNPAHPGEEDIFSHLLLTSDIKGYVHNPGYYFSSEADSVARHLDLVMMTNGWRRFKWEDVLADKWPVITHQPENYITFEGSISGLTKSELINQELTGFFILKNSGQQMMQIPVGRDGKFTVPGLFYYDTAKLYYQFNNDKNKVLTTKAIIDIKNNFLQRPAGFTADPVWSSRIFRPESQVLNRNIQMARKNNDILDVERKVKTLANVTVVAKQKSNKQKMEEEYVTGFFSGGDGYTFVLEDDPSANGSLSVLTYLQGKVAGLQISGAGTQISMNWRGSTPTLFYNEMQSDVQLIQNLTMSDVAMIKVFKPPFFGAPGGGSGGAIAVYTKKGAKTNTANIKGLSFSKVPGYLAEKQFYSPDYSLAETDRSQEDNRTTLYWNPFLLTEKNNRRIFITFYNNDVTKKFRVIVEGLNVEGKLTRIEKIVE